MNTRTLKRQIPPLETGDELTRAEFERRYFAMPHVKKAELIEGEVIMGSPVSPQYHGEKHTIIQGWMFTYWLSTPGVAVADNSSFRIDRKNELQPDVSLYILPEFGGRLVRGRKKLMDGSPELVAEVAASSVSIDLNRKFRVYRRNQVHEYIVWRTYDEALDWFVLRDGEYVRHEPDPADGLLKSGVFPGLWLDAAALLTGDLPKVMTALARGTAAPEHASFVQKLASQRKA